MKTPFDHAIERIKTLLIDEWKHCWKLYSVQLNAAGLVLMTAVGFLRDGVNMLPPSMVPYLPHAQTVATIFFVAGMAARVLRQPDKKA